VTGTTVSHRQNQPDALLLARAFRRRYALARSWRLLRLGISLLIGTAGVLLALAEPSTGEYISAVAAAWLLLGRTVLDSYEQRHRREGAIAHELFDTRVLGLPWSSSTAGDPPIDEDVRNWAHGRSEDGLRDWYADTGSAEPPVDTLICQRSTITWARQDHTTYAQYLRWSAGVVLVGTALLGLVLDLSLGEYLLRLGLPMLPAVLDVLDIAKANAQVAQTKARLERLASSLLHEAQAAGIPPTVAECRQLQDGIFATRLLPGAPDWLYRVTRARRQDNMEGVVAEQVQALPASLR
jgi:hypothetical protein